MFYRVSISVGKGEHTLSFSQPLTRVPVAPCVCQSDRVHPPSVRSGLQFNSQCFQLVLKASPLSVVPVEHAGASSPSHTDRGLLSLWWLSRRSGLGNVMPPKSKLLKQEVTSVALSLQEPGLPAPPLLHTGRTTHSCVPTPCRRCSECAECVGVDRFALMSNDRHKCPEQRKQKNLFLSFFFSSKLYIFLSVKVWVDQQFKGRCLLEFYATSSMQVGLRLWLYS